MRLWILLGAINAFISVAAGAFGAHGLKKVLEPDMLAVFETGARYQMFHALGLVGIGLFLGMKDAPLANTAGWSMLVGIVLFSFSLYALALTGIRGLGAITPLGGLAFLAGWLLLAIAAWKAT